MRVAPHEFIHPDLHGHRATDADDESAFDDLTARVLATPDGRKWMDELAKRSGIPGAFLIANWKARINRMRERWRTGELTPS